MFCSSQCVRRDNKATNNGEPLLYGQFKERVIRHPLLINLINDWFFAKQIN